MTDNITLLRSRGPLLTKRWSTAGLVPYDRAKTFTTWTEPVESLSELSAVLTRIESDPQVCAIRGAARRPVPAGQVVTRDLDTFADAAHHWVCLDIDSFEPILWDPVAEPAGAVSEFILSRLPREFHGASYHWQLSSSAGRAGAEGVLKAHVWFWLAEPADELELEAWARGSGLVAAKVVDITTLRTVQVHYTAAPVIDEGVSCPVVERSGYVEGLLGDDVPLHVEPGWRTAVAERSDGGRQLVDPREKPGLIGAFCRAYPPERVVVELLPDQFEFEDGSDYRLNWLGGGGAVGGACITDDLLHIYNSHSTDPLEGRAVNMWDLVRHYVYGHLDDAVAADARAFMTVADMPSQAAMTAFVTKLPEVQGELVLQAEVRAAPDHSHGADVLWGIAKALGCEPEDLEDIFDVAQFDRQFSRTAFDAKTSKFKVMVPDGEVLTAVRADLATVLRRRFPRIADNEALELRCRARAAAKEWPATRADAFVKEILGRVYGSLADAAISFRQFTSIAMGVDMFSTGGRMEKQEERLHLIFPHAPLETGAWDDAVVADYRAHWPRVDDYLELLVASRFASNRKAAHIWIQADSDWGKNFFLDTLGAAGLVHSTSSDELERALAGAPVGMTMAGMRRVWVLAVDEFKGVTRELKQLSSELTFSPKNEPSVTVPLYLKHFMSAEDVPSLVSAETGVEAQFANRFMYMRERGSLTARPVFAAGPARYFESVKWWVAQRVNELVERYRGLGGPREAAAEAERVVRAMHGRYSLSAAVEGGAQTLEERLPDIARRFADEMVAAHQAPGLGGGGAGGGGRADGRARGDVFQKDGAWYMRRCAAALDLWLEDEFGRSEGAKVRYKARQILELLGGAVTLSLRAQEHRPGLPRVVKCIKLAEVTAENTETALL